MFSQNQGAVVTQETVFLVLVTFSSFSIAVSSGI